MNISTQLRTPSEIEAFIAKLEKSGESFFADIFLLGLEVYNSKEKLEENLKDFKSEIEIAIRLAEESRQSIDSTISQLEEMI